MSQQQPTIYTIHESQLNNGNGEGQRNSNTILIDTSSIPVTQQAMPPMHHHPLQPQQQYNGDITVTSQPQGSGQAGSSRVAPESQNVVYSVHPVFNMLDHHEALLIRQRADCTSTCCGFESVNTYTVRAKDGSPVLKAIENSNCCERCCFEGNREYNLSLVYGDEVVARIRKPYRVSRFCCYSNSVRIESPEDNPIGHIRQLFTLFGHPRYAIYDCQMPPKRPSFLLESVSCRFCCTPCLCTCICGNKEFRIVSVDTKEEVGTISRHWVGDSRASRAGGQTGSTGNNHDEQTNNGDLQLQESSDHNAEDAPATGSTDPEDPFVVRDKNRNNNSDDQLFGVQFVQELEARHKVLLLSACFMMDFFYFENDRRRRKLASC